MSGPLSLGLMFLIGLAIPVMASLNAALGLRIGSPAIAALILFGVAFLCIGLVALIRGEHADLGARNLHWSLFLGGTVVASYILAMTMLAPRIGIGNAVMLVLLGQLVSAALIDHIGLLGTSSHPMTLTRFIGLLGMAAGAFIAIR
jgi:bacterial/archaeal transporter family-2 protein